MPEPHILLIVVAPAATRQSGADSRLARRRLAQARRQHAAHQDFVDAVGRDPRPLDGGRDRARAERRGRHVLEVAEKAAHRRARRADDDDGVWAVMAVSRLNDVERLRGCSPRTPLCHI